MKINIKSMKKKYWAVDFNCWAKTAKKR